MEAVATNGRSGGGRMPIYEYECQGCESRFEVLVRSADVPACPTCGSEALERVFSLPRVQSATTQDLAMRAARRRDAAQAKDRMHDRLRYEQSHDRHG